MIKQGLLNEFNYEAENTRKLLKAIPDSALDYRPQPHLWSVAQLASHIANIYTWFDGTFNYDTFDIGNLERVEYDLTSAADILAKFEGHYQEAKKVLENSDESTYMNDWKMVAGENVLIPASPKIAMVRGFLFNHLYHHRGELVAHLRAAGYPVPGLYGPTYEDSQKR
ncbi:DinB family protein [Chryseobacterium suipulveris]|uniref:DinB family protein n=1 Tax=Chryseobacterium suipulveris TaxID=2929800 RepID=A0ABY4BTJ3_9FLAO|nr:DinB family protein [Chryseobacterium suipulveris]UOE41161.1 DinB family protein [Chryseobacterium suipulveris]